MRYGARAKSVLNWFHNSEADRPHPIHFLCPGEITFLGPAALFVGPDAGNDAGVGFSVLILLIPLQILVQPITGPFPR